MESGSGQVWCSLKFWCCPTNPIFCRAPDPHISPIFLSHPHKSFPHFMLVRNKPTTSSPGSVYKPLSIPVAALMLLFPVLSRTPSVPSALLGRPPCSSLCWVSLQGIAWTLDRNIMWLWLTTLNLRCIKCCLCLFIAATDVTSRYWSGESTGIVAVEMAVKQL